MKALESLGLDEKQINALLSVLDQEGFPELRGLLQALAQTIENSKIPLNPEAQQQAQQQILGQLAKQDSRAMDFLIQAGLTEAEAKNLLGKLQTLKETSGEKVLHAEQKSIAVENSSGKADLKPELKEMPAKPGFLKQLEATENRQNQGLNQILNSEKPSAVKIIPMDEKFQEAKLAVKMIVLEAKPGNILLRSSAPVSAGLQKILEAGGKPLKVDMVIQQANVAAENPMKTMEAFRASSAEVITARTTQASRIMHQIINQATFKPGSGSNEIQIRLDPPSLGTVRMNISTVGDSIRTVIVAENHAVKQIIENNFQQLRDSMNGQGLKVDSFSVLVGGDQQQAWQNGKPLSSAQRLPGDLNLDDSGVNETELVASTPAPRLFRPGQYPISVMA